MEGRFEGDGAADSYDTFTGLHQIVGVHKRIDEANSRQFFVAPQFVRASIAKAIAMLLYVKGDVSRKVPRDSLDDFELVAMARALNVDRMFRLLVERE